MRKALTVSLAMLVLLSDAVLEATTIVVFRQPDRIVFAADSMVRVTRREGEPTSSSACKIRRSGKFWFVLGGQIDFADNGPDSFSMIAQAIAPTLTVKDALEAIVGNGGLQRLEERFRALVGRVPQIVPMLAVAIGGLDGDELKVGLVLVSQKSRDQFQLDAQWGIPNVERLFFEASVVRDSLASRLIKSPPRLAWVERGDAAAARRIISLQIAATPTRVGTPIDVLELRPDGRALWVGRDKASACLPIRKSA